MSTLADAQRAHITSTLRETNGVVGGPNGAAVQLGMARTTLLYKMQRLGMSNGKSRQPTAQSSGQLVEMKDTHSAGEPALADFSTVVSAIRHQIRDLPQSARWKASSDNRLSAGRPIA